MTYTVDVGTNGGSAYTRPSSVPSRSDTILGTNGTNYYQTVYGYDHRGRQSRTVASTGTIDRTVMDGQGRVVSTWVGTNDTPTSGEWSPTNNTGAANMIEVSANVYDGGGVGDGNLTQTTSYPNDGSANRVSQFAFDWRDRQVASKAGVQTSEDSTTHRPILFTVYDNLNEAIVQQQYDGDTVTVSTTAPSASLLRAQTNTDYDNQGRVYRTYVVSVW